MTRNHRAKARKLGRTEKQVTAEVVDAARMLGLDLRRRNVGLAFDARGKATAFGEAGDADWYAVLPDGRHLDLEIKREHWDPSKARGKTAERWAKQLAKLQQTNARNGVGFWTDNAPHFLAVMRAVLDGARVEEEGTTTGPRIILP